MGRYQEPSCDKCGCQEFEYDKAWQEYSCKECGWIVKDREVISAIKRSRESSKEVIQEHFHKETNIGSANLANGHESNNGAVLTLSKNAVYGNKNFNQKAKPGGENSQYNFVESVFGIENERLRNKAIRNLIMEANATKVQGLGLALYDQNDTVHNFASRTLVKIEKATINILKRALKGEEKDFAKKRRAKVTLSAIQNLKGLLVQNLFSDNIHIQKRSAQALERICDEKAVDPLILLLRHTDRNIREIASESLATNMKKKHIDKLMSILKNEKNGVRWYVGVALVRFYKKEMKAIATIVPILLLGGLFAFFASSLVGKTSGGIDLGGILKGFAGFFWVCSVFLALFILPRFLFRIARVKKRIIGLDKSMGQSNHRL